MKVYKVELFIIDFDGVGKDDIIDMLENTNYPNRCISPEIKAIHEADIGHFTDDHPLNKSETCEAEYQKLFPLYQGS